MNHPYTQDELNALLLQETKKDSPDLAKIRTLLKQGANPNKRDEYGNNSVMLAARNGKVEAIRTLANAGAEINLKNKNDTTAVMLAAGRGYTVTVIALKNLGADLNWQNIYGTTASMKAARRDDIATLNALFGFRDDEGHFIVDRHTVNKKGESIASILLASGKEENIKLALEIRPDLRAAWKKAIKPQKDPRKAVIERSKTPPAPSMNG